MLLKFNIFNNLFSKLINNPTLSAITIFVIGLIIVLAVKLIKKYEIRLNNLIIYLILLVSISFFFKKFSLPVYYIPDLFLITFLALILFDIRQKININIGISFAILFTFIFLSDPRSDFEFNNNYIVALKPLLYLIYFQLISNANLKIDLKNLLILILVLYPFLLISKIFYYWLETGYYFTRPYFLFENNFEIPFLIYCFIALTFIYGIKDIKFFLLLTASVFLTGSRSGLVSYLIISIIYLYYIYGKRGLFLGTIISSMLICYFIYIRSGGYLNLSINSVDRFSNLLHVLSIYDFSFKEILKYPMGFGIYQKIPIGICEKVSIYAEWSTGNMHNCDPIMMQSFVARALFQYGIYVLILLPILYLYEIQRVMSFNFAVLLMIPITVASFSVGGFSNGLAFLGLLICIFSFNQNNHFSNLK